MNGKGLSFPQAYYILTVNGKELLFQQAYVD